ncbi:MAG: hypothetical protein HC798_00240 [Polaribacter sp.]|nr:hypothetical protein [Polaribacter sp.]
MHKKLEADLMSLAHSILQMKNKEDVFALKTKASELYEKLSLLAFVEEYVNTTPQLKEDKEELEAKMIAAINLKESKIDEVETKSVIEELENAVDKKEVEEIVSESIVYELEDEIETETIENEEINLLEENEEKIDEPLTELIFEEPKPTFSFKNDVKDVGERKTLTLLDELKDTVSVDITADMFDAKPISVNEKLAKGIQIGLNDRISFCKNLFANSQEDYNRVISQLNSFKTEEDAVKFVKRTVKPDYDWSTQEELENRFLGFIQNKFS